MPKEKKPKEPKKKKLSKLAKKKMDPSSKFWRTKADQTYSLYIREKHDNKCVVCGTNQHIQCAHFFPREIRTLRFDPSNSVALCAACHKMKRSGGIKSFHLNPFWAAVWVSKNLPESWQWLMDHFEQQDPPNYVPDYKAAYEATQKLYNDLLASKNISQNNPQK